MRRGQRNRDILHAGDERRFCPQGAVCCAEPIPGQVDPPVSELHCRQIKHNKNHCGRCNHACTKGKRPDCCYGRCRDLDTDPRNCGKCLDRCPADKPICFGGRCRAKCPPGTRRCGSTCGQPRTEVCCGGQVIAKEDMQFDEENCGACGSTCPDEARYQCCPKRGKGACVNTHTDGEHCSGCGQFCSGLPGAPDDKGCECRNGECVPRPFYANGGCTTCPCR